MVGFSEFLLGTMMSLVANAISSATGYEALPYFQRRKVERRVEEATAEVVEPLMPFLSREGVAEEQQRLLIQTCVDELRPYADDPTPLFEGSLDGQKIFDTKYADRDLPQAIRDEGLTHVYALLFPRIATLLCRIPSAVKDWENEAWSDNYRRLDEIAAELRHLFERLDSIESTEVVKKDAILHLARKSLAQRIGMKLDLTGLRSDAPLAGRLRDFFVHPQIVATIREKPVSIEADSDSIAQFLTTSQCAVVRGAPGSGKSTWALWLQQEALTDRWGGLVIRCELRGLNAEDLPSMHELLRSNTAQHVTEEIGPELIRDWINKELVVIILDGFDEVRPSDRDMVLEWIENLRIAINKCSLIVTSRDLTTTHLNRFSDAWNHWTIASFDEPRIVAYIKRWFAFTPLLEDGKREVDPVSLATLWRLDPTIGPLTGNPLLLSTLLMVHHLDGSLPSGRSELYRRYVDGMLGLWDDRRNVSAADVPLPIPQKRRILRAFAVHLQFAEKDQIDEEEAVEVTQNELQRMNLDHNATAVLDTLRERSGLIIGPGVYSFVHKSVGEYFVADAIIQGDLRHPSGDRVDRFRLFETRDDDRWNVVTFLWAGLASMADVESFVEECIQAECTDLAYGILFDQYERFSHDFRRHQLLRLVNGETACQLTVGNTYWVCGGPAVKEPELEVPSRVLRGIRETNVIELINHTVKDGTLTWADCTSVSGQFRDLLWMTVASNPDDIDDWHICIAAPPPPPSPDAWYYWVAESLMSEISGSGGSVRMDFMRKFAEVVPQGGGYLTVALMSVVAASYAPRKRTLASSRVFPVSSQGFDVLEEYSRLGIKQSLLDGTSDWSTSLDHIIRSIDLLMRFADIVSTHPAPTDEEKVRAEQIVLIVEELVSKRGHN